MNGNDDRLLDAMEAWLRRTRMRPAPGFSDRVMRAIEASGRTGEAAGRGRERAPRRFAPSFRRRWPRAWVLAPTALAAAVLLLVFGPRGTGTREARVVAPARDQVSCEFRLDADEAHDVCLVGTFNQWKVCDTRLHPSPDGSWTVTLALPRGRHEYMFVVDGRWVTDPAAAHHVDDGFGRRNALLLL